MRVIGGELKGRPIEVPRKSRGLRPTTGLVREAIFDLLESRAAVRGAKVVDLFAGTGAIGIEAASRGANEVTFVERDRELAASIRRTVSRLQIDPARVRIIEQDVRTFVASPHEFTVAFLDPPYEFEGVHELLGLLEAGVVVVEAAVPTNVPAGWELVKRRRYGGTLVEVLEKIDQGMADAGRED